MTTSLDVVDPLPTEDQATSSEARQFYESIGSQLPVMITGLKEKVELIQDRVQLIQRLHESDDFKVLSKVTRNNLLHGLQEEIDDLEEIAKVAIRSLKKIKRVRISEEKVDQLLEIPEYIRNASTESEDQND